MDQTTLLWGIPAVIAFFLSIAALFTTKVYPARQERKNKGAGFLFWMIVSWAFSGIGNILQYWFEGREISWQTLLFTLFFTASAVIMFVKANKPAA